MEKLMQEELLLIEGGKNWWYIVGGSIMVVSGVAGSLRREVSCLPTTAVSGLKSQTD